MKIRNITFWMLVFLLGTFVGRAQIIISDNYNITTVGTGFALTNGVNTGINPPATRLTGSAAANLRYYQTATARATSFYDINGSRLRVSQDATIGRFTLSANGSSAFDFGPSLSAPYASPTNKSVYEIKITMRNNASSTARYSFGIATSEGDANIWDFAVQLYRGAGTDDFYTVRKRFDQGSINGAGTANATGDVNEVMTTTPAGTWVSGGQSNINFLIRVTDAGSETNAYNSRVEVALIDNSGTNWVYDTSTDAALPNGFRFDGAGRYIIFDQASNNSGTVFYDNFSITFISGPTPPSDRNWTGNGSDNNWSNADNWGGIAPVNGVPIAFSGTNRQTNVNDISDLTVASVTFNNGGFSLSGNLLTLNGAISNASGNNIIGGDLAWGLVAAHDWTIANGSEVSLNGISTVEVTGDHTVSGGGTLRLKGTMNIGQVGTANPAFIVNEGKHLVDGGTFNSRGGYRLASSGSGAGAQTILTNGATFALTVVGANLRVGDSAHPITTQLHIDNSSLTMAGGNMGIPYAAGGTSQVLQNGGTVSGGIVAFNDNGAGVGSYSIKNGVLQPIEIREDTAAGSSSIQFDNAILRAASGANSGNFFSGVDLAEIQAGGLTLDAQTDVTIAQPLSGAGNLVKSNFAAVTLTGANTYSGNTLVQGGKLVLPTVQTNTTTVQVSNGAELGVKVSAPGSSLSVPAVNFNGASFNTLSFDLGNFSSPTAALIKVPSLSVSGPVVINVANGLQLTTGQFPLVDYNGVIAGGFQFTLGTLPPGVSATLSNNTANSSIDLNITGVPGYRWTGAVNGDWDGSTQNWIDRQTQLPSVYTDGFPVEFLDGASNGLVNIVGFPTPTIINVSNNTLPYVWSGGAIGNTPVPLLKKFGSGSLTRVGGEADFLTGIELNAGSYVVSNFSDANFITILTDTSAGTGSFVKQDTNILTMATNHSTYDGAIIVQQGILKLGTTNSPLGSTNGSTTIAAGATLDLNDIVAPHEPVIVAGSGTTGQGAIIDSTTGTGVANNLTDVTMTGNTTMGSPNGGRWDIRVRTGTGPGLGLRGNGFNLTKVGSGSLSIASQRNLGVQTPYWQMNLGDIFILEGALTLAESLTPGNPSKGIFVASGTTLGTYDLNATNPILRTVSITNATITGSGGGATDTNVFNGPILVTGSAHLRPIDAKLIINGNIGGSGAVNISASGTGTIYLNGINTYPGGTTVTNGNFGGSGSLAGNFIMLAGTNSPGGVGIGTFTVNGNATLAGTTLMELNRSSSPNSDRMVAGGTLVFGGTLTVTLGVGAPSPQAGDVYQLFNKGSSSGFSAINLPNISGLPGGLAWNTSNLTVNGTISVTGTATQPTINSISVSGSNFIFSGTGGVEGGSYTVLSSTNVALPVTNWIPVATNLFGPGGGFSYTNAINPATPQTFYLLKVP